MIERRTKNERPVHLGGLVVFSLGLVLLCVACNRSAGEPSTSAKGKRTSTREPTVEEVLSTGISNAETCFNAIDDNRNLLIDEGCGVDQGQVQFVIAWLEPEADVDLYVTDPDGEIAPVDGTTELGLVRSIDCPDEKNICGGQNYENVYLEADDVAPGIYLVRVRVERIPEGVKVLNVSLGTRLPNGTRAHEILLYEEAQEVVLEFSVARVSKPPSSHLGRASKPLETELPSH